MRTIHHGRLAGALTAAAVLILSTGVVAQEQGQEKQRKEDVPSVIYRLEFVVRELEDGKRIDSRSYVMSAKDHDMARLRVGTRVPISYGGNTTSYQYQDVGINIDCHLKEEGSSVLLGVNWDESSVISPKEAGLDVQQAPVFRHAHAEFDSIVQPAKPTVIGTFDDVTTRRRYELEVTAVKIK